MTAQRPDSPRSSIPGEVPGVHRFAHDAMACTFSLRIAGIDGAYARQAAWAAFDEVDRLEQLLNRFIPHSDVARINALLTGQSTKVAVETLECLQVAARIHEDTGGAFDIAFRGRRTDASAAPGGITPVVFDPQNRAIGVQVAGVALDLGGIGKGYAVDRMAAVLREWRIEAALIDSGQSTVYALGPPSDGSPWRVGLRRPDRQEDVQGTVALRDWALSGSGQRLHGAHIIDPRTGLPADLYDATWALAPQAAMSDALSTAFMAMATVEVEDYCRRHTEVGAILRPHVAEGRELLSYGACHDLTRGGNAPT